jgi:hypothetical protein
VQGLTGWTQVDDDVFGAFGYNLLLWQWLSRKVANQVTDSYRGDRYIFLENGDQNAMLLKSVWTSTKAARAAKATLLTALRVRYHQHVTSAGMPGTFVDTDGGVYLWTHGATMTVAYAPSPALARQLGTAPTT